MIQQVHSLLSPPRLHAFFQKSKPPGSWILSLAALLWLVSLQAAPFHPAHPAEAEKPAGTLRLPAPAGDTSITATICANGFYVFNGDTIEVAGQYTAVLLAADGTDSIVSLDLVVLPVSTGSVTATICAGSTYAFNGENLSQAGTYQAVLGAANGCDSTVTLTLLVKPNALTKLEAGICTGSTYVFQGDTLTESGFYTASLLAANGCDSLVQLTLDVVDFFDIHLQASVCAGENYLFNGDTLHAAGSYVDSLTAAGGCDSIVTLTLKVLPVPATLLEVGICTGSTYIFQGDTLKISGIYRDTLQAKNGCDSLITLDLSVVDFFDIQQTVSICAGESYPFGGLNLQLEGVYVDSLTAAGGCDSTVTLTLHILPVQTGTAEATICQGDTLAYNGELLTAAGTYEFVLTGANGCDSTVTFTLKVLPTASSALTATICQGETYVFNGDTLNQSGTYTQLLTAANGCDSTLTLALQVLPVQATDIKATVCAGESYVYDGDTLTSSGAYPFVFTGLNGCDSTVTIALTVLPVLSGTLQVHICAGESYVFDGDTLDQAGIYTALLFGTQGCDSTLTLTLEVRPVQATNLTATSCAGTDYLFNGTALTQTGIYTALLTGINGCDSTVTLQLTVLPTHSSAFSAITCANEPYLYDGQILTETGSYDFVLTGANGCDSTVTVNLTVRPVFETTIAASVCAGESYVYNGDTLTASGHYPYLFHAINSCDSTVTVQLTVRPLLSSNISVSVCAGNSYLFDGDTLTASGTYVATHPGSNGCDSTATLHLSIVPFFETAVQASICNGESYVFGNDTLHTQGTYTDSLVSAGGCDSIVNLNLTVRPLSASLTEATICPGASYVFNGQLLNVSGSYTAQLSGVNGCDSTATLILTVLQANVTQLTATICSNESYPFDGDFLTAPGNYTSTLTGVHGCDSVVVLSLTVLPVQSGSFAASVCAGGALEYNGQVLTASGAYLFTLPGAAANGCDSVVTLILTVLPAIAPTSTAATICAGGTYDFYGTPLTDAGSYTAHLPSVAGCDSTVLLDLVVLPAISTQINAAICSGESYPFNGQSFSTAGIYTVLYQSAAGCDSIVTLVLAVNTVNTTVVLQNGTLTTQAFNATYQWIDCNGNTPIPGATGSSYTPTVTGSYALLITQNGCTDVSACQLVEVVSAYEPLAESSWQLLPNPARQQAVLSLQTALPGAARIEIYDAAGRLMQKQPIPRGANQVGIDLTDMPEGLLIVRLVTDQGASTKRLVKADR